jgi:hypothetical protein
MMLLGLMSRWTRFRLCTAAKPEATCVVIWSANFTSSRPERLMILECLTLHKLHRVKVMPTGSAQVEDRRNIRVTKAGRRAGFAQKTKPRRFITEISLTNNFQGHWAVQIDIERLISDSHFLNSDTGWPL